MFTKDWKEQRNNRIDIEDFRYPGVNEFVRLVHGLELNPSNIKLTIKLMLVADKYEGLNLRDKCENFIEIGMNQENVVDTLIFLHISCV